MGFYGDITNTNKNQFTFDRTYTSRSLMDARIKLDGIYLGRYVLVEYGLEAEVAYVQVYEKNGVFYTSKDYNPLTRLIWIKDKPDELGENYISTNEIVYVIKDGVKHFYKCNNDINTAKT